MRLNPIIPHDDRPTLGAALERDRLERRVHRLERVVASLRARAQDRQDSGIDVPRPLAASLDDFQRELAEVRRALTRFPRVAERPVQDVDVVPARPVAPTASPGRRSVPGRQLQTPARGEHMPPQARPGS